MKPVDWGVSSFAWLETKYGRLLSLNPPAHHDQYERLAYQPYINILLERDEYGLFVDCGAYIGAFTIVGASHCEKVIAYEASPFLYGILLFNLRFKMNTECKYAWVGNKIQIPKSKEEDLQMVTTQRDFEYNIPIVELDSEILPFKDSKILLKMDIEGNEVEALKACPEILKLPNIDWVIDIHIHRQKVTKEEVLGFFYNKVIYSVQDVLVIKSEEDPLFKNWELIRV